MNNFKFYALTRFKLEVSANVCFTELKKAHGEAAPGRATVFRWFGDFKEDSAENDSESDSDCDARSPITSRTTQMIRNVEEKINDKSTTAE